jgi:amino acid transporter
LSETAAHHDEDAARLAALGYTSEFKRDMSLWANFSLGFTYLSPVVGIYSLFGLLLPIAGPPMIWSLVIVGIGQFLVAQVFSEIVAQYPIAGGVYPWARRLWGRRWAWMAGWIYLAALLSTIASVVYGAGPYLSFVLGVEPSTSATIACALGLIVFATFINLAGTRVLALAAIAGFAAEIVGALAVGAWLLLTHREQTLSIFTDSFGAGAGSYVPAFLAASLLGIYQYYGFEACGDVAEEVPNPGKRIPTSMRRTIYIGGAAAIFVTMALLLSISDFGAVISGEDTDPVGTVLVDAFGETGTRVVFIVILLSFISCAMSLQAAASRLTYSYARDDMIFGSRILKKFSQTRHVPPYAMLGAALIPAAIVIGSQWMPGKALTLIISFGSLGIYVAFQMVVFAALRARVKGWTPSGAFTLGAWGMPVTVAALVYGVSAIFVLVKYTAAAEGAWYERYSLGVSAVVVIAVGLVYMLASKPHERSDAPHGDAIDAELNPREHERRARQIENL